MTVCPVALVEYSQGCVQRELEKKIKFMRELKKSVHCSSVHEFFFIKNFFKNTTNKAAINQGS